MVLILWILVHMWMQDGGCIFVVRFYWFCRFTGWFVVKIGGGVILCVIGLYIIGWNGLIALTSKRDY